MSGRRRIYLDHHAATPLLAEAHAAMLPWTTGLVGNPGSIHQEGREAARGVSRAREEVAALLGARPKEIIFTASGTEANNLAVFGVARARGRGHLITTRGEHPAVLAPLETLEREGFAVDRVPVDGEGRVSVEEVLARCRPDTLLVSAAAGNHELGTLAPLAELGAALKARGILLHTDAAVAAGWLDLPTPTLGVDLLSLSGHKMGGPRGAGALWVRAGVALAPHVVGGPQERGRRGGAEDVAALAGFGAAARVAAGRTPAARARVEALRERLFDGLLRSWPTARRLGAPGLAGCLNVAFTGLEGEALLLSLDLEGVAVSSGAACSSGTLETSPAVAALGLPAELARASVRFTLGFETTEDEIDEALGRVATVLERQRAFVDGP